MVISDRTFMIAAGVVGAVGGVVAAELAGRGDASRRAAFDDRLESLSREDLQREVESGGMRANDDLGYLMPLGVGAAAGAAGITWGVIGGGYNLMNGFGNLIGNTSGGYVAVYRPAGGLMAAGAGAMLAGAAYTAIRRSITD